MMALPDKRYQVIYADPPWSYDTKKPTASKGGSRGDGYSSGVNYYYKTMNLDDIMNFPVSQISEKDCVCFMWATNPLLPEGIATLRKWGFEYKTTITWQKERCKGMGYWFRGHTEFLLLGVRGNVRAFRSLEHNIISAPVGAHSVKPNEFRALIERATPNMERIELFARQRFDGWDAWGDEVSVHTQTTIAPKGMPRPGWIAGNEVATEFRKGGVSEGTQKLDQLTKVTLKGEVKP